MRASAVLLAAVLGATAAVFGLAVAVVLWVPGAREHALTVLALTLPLHSLAVLAVVHACLRRSGTGWGELGFRRPTARLLHLLWQVPALLVVVLFVQGLTFLVLGEVRTSGDGALEDVTAGAGPVTVLAVLVAAVVLVPVWEEAVFRGVLQGGLRRRWPVWAAVAGSAALFAVCHGIPLLLPYLLALGVGLGVLREVHRTLWAPVLAHGCVNALASASLLGALLG